MEKNVTPTTMEAPPQSEASPFVAPTRRTIIPLKKQKKEGTEADLGWPNQAIDLALESVKHFFVKNPDIYITKFEQYKDLLTKAKGNSDIVQLAQSYTNDLTSLIKMLPQLVK